MPPQTLHDSQGSFEVTLLHAPQPRGTALFAPGAGGNPTRHLPLLHALSHHGFSVIAPHFDLYTSPHPTAEFLLLRASRLEQSLNTFSTPDAPVLGIGHSIGATLLLALSGAQLWLGPGTPLPIPHSPRLHKLALLTPATGFFRAPGALDQLQTPLLIWAAEKDTITPPAQSEFLAQSLSPRLPVHLQIEPQANHFSVMHSLPPQREDTHPNRDEFLSRLTASILAFAGPTS